MVSCYIVGNVATRPMPTFSVGDRIEVNLSYASYVTYQPPGHSKCDKIYDMDTTSRRAKLLILKLKGLSFYTTDFSYTNIST